MKLWKLHILYVKQNGIHSFPLVKIWIFEIYSRHLVLLTGPEEKQVKINHSILVLYRDSNRAAFLKDDARILTTTTFSNPSKYLYNCRDISIQNDFFLVYY
jgi:hypothetical protein